MGSEGLLNGLVLTRQDNPLPPFLRGGILFNIPFLTARNGCMASQGNPSIMSGCSTRSQSGLYKLRLVSRL
jgi:hypothetical protein